MWFSNGCTLKYQDKKILIAYVRINQRAGALV